MTSSAEYMRNWRMKNREKIKKYAEKHKKHWNNKIKIQQKKYYIKLLDLVLEGYGEKCSICQSRERLCLDHLDGKGISDPPKNRNSVYRWVIKNNFPKEFRLLCNRCNLLDGMLRKHTILGINGINDLLVLIGIAEIKRRGFGAKTDVYSIEKIESEEDEG